MQFPNLYQVIRTFPDGEIANAGDATKDWDRAYDMLAETLDEGCIPRVFFTEFVCDTGVHDRTTEVTDEFAAEYARIRQERGLMAAE